MTERFMIVANALEHVRKSHRIGVKHRAAQVTWKTISTRPNYINVGGTGRDAFFEHHGADIDQRQNASLNDLLMADFAPLYTSVSSKLLDEADHFRVGHSFPAATFITI